MKIAKIFQALIFIILVTCNMSEAAMIDKEVLNSETKTITDSNGTVSLQLDWLRRPGEMALTVIYNGYLTQEGLVNFYISVNGEQREFMTMKKETGTRAQVVKIISFHPVVRERNVNRLESLEEDTVVDSLLFRNAPYYKQFGNLNIEIIFFCHGRWDGDDNNQNSNYRFVFVSPIEDFPGNHF